MKNSFQQMIKEKIHNQFKVVEDKGYDFIKKEHINDYQQLFDRVKFYLEDDCQTQELPTDKRLILAQKAAQDWKRNTVYCDFGRYLVFACSRPGG